MECIGCKNEIHTIADLHGKEAPTAFDYSICQHCGQLYFFDEKGNAYPCESSMEKALKKSNPKLWKLIKQIRQIIAEHNAKN